MTRPTGAAAGAAAASRARRFARHAAAVSDELAPRGVLERAAARAVARAAWRLRTAPDPTPDSARADRDDARALGRALALWRRVRALAPTPIWRAEDAGPTRPASVAERRPIAPPYHVEGLDHDAAPPPLASSAPPASSAALASSSTWRARLVFDPAVSDASPVVRGSRLTVGLVVSRVVDGWTWAEIRRAHPELTDDDIRACLAYHVEQDDLAWPAA